MVSSEGKKREIIYKGVKIIFMQPGFLLSSLELKLSKTLSVLVMRGGGAPHISTVQNTQAHPEFLTTSIPKQKPRLHKKLVDSLGHTHTLNNFSSAICGTSLFSAVVHCVTVQWSIKINDGCRCQISWDGFGPNLG